jgi:DNA polymerase-1
VTLLGTYHPAYLKKDEFRSAPTFLRDIKKFGRILGGATVDPQVRVIENPSFKAFEEIVKDCWHNEWAFDLETPGNQLRSIAFCGLMRGQHYEAIAFDLQVISSREWWPVFDRVFKRAKRIVVQNGAFDLPIMRSYLVEIPWDKVWDTMLGGYVLNQDDYVGLSHLASLYLDVPAWKHVREDPMKLLHYNGLDAAYTWVLYEKICGELKQSGQLPFFEKHLLPVLWKVIIPLNTRGMAVDLSKKSTMVAEFDAELQRWFKRMHEHFPEGPPLGKDGGLSNPQVQKILYEDLGLTKQHHPSTKMPTADKTALKKLLPQDTSGTVALLFERSELKERENHLNPPTGADGRVHSRYVLGGDEKHVELTKEGTSRAKDKGTRTGRLASREPNLQNVPASCRVLYVPSYPHWWLVEGDSSQIEARLTQWFSGDAALKDAIDHEDVYLFTLLLLDRHTGLYGVHKDGWGALAARKTERDPRVLAWRQEAKRGFLGWSYRMGPGQLRDRQGIPYARAKAVIEGLNRAFPKVLEFWQQCMGKAKSLGYLENPYGRRKSFSSLDAPKVCNFLSQSTAADILFEGQKRLAVGIDGSLGGDPELGYLLTTTHDSNLVEGPGPERLSALLKSAMEFPVACMGGFVVPCNVKVGKNWRDLR